jgi:hypothetical protein
MSWRLTEKPKTVRVTRPLAREFANMERVTNERPLRERRLVVYRKILAEGGFRPVAWAKCYCKETDETYRVNGQHTSIMLSSLETIPEFYATIESYEADTLADVSRLHATFDAQSQSRTANDIYLSFAGAVPELRDVPSTIISTATPAIWYAKIQDQTWSMTAPERAEGLLDNVEFIQWLATIINTGPAYRSLRRSPVVAAMLLTWQRDPDDATIFWEGVRDETGEHPHDPDRKLARWLLLTAMGGHSIVGKNRQKAGPREFFVKCLRSWNAWRKDTTITLRYIPDAELPAVI